MAEKLTTDTLLVAYFNTQTDTDTLAFTNTHITINIQVVYTQ